MILESNHYLEHNGPAKVVRRWSVLVAACLFFPSLLLGSEANAEDTQTRQERANGDKHVQPLDHLLPGIRLSHPGELSDAHGPTYGPSRNPHYHLKWVTPDGDVNWLDADAQSGQVLSTSPGRDRFDDR